MRITPIQTESIRRDTTNTTMCCITKGSGGRVTSKAGVGSSWSKTMGSSGCIRANGVKGKGMVGGKIMIQMGSGIGGSISTISNKVGGRLHILMEVGIQGSITKG